MSVFVCTIVSISEIKLVEEWAQSYLRVIPNCQVCVGVLANYTPNVKNVTCISANYSESPQALALLRLKIIQAAKRHDFIWFSNLDVTLTPEDFTVIAALDFYNTCYILPHTKTYGIVIEMDSRPVLINADIYQQNYNIMGAEFRSVIMPVYMAMGIAWPVVTIKTTIIAPHRGVGEGPTLTGDYIGWFIEAKKNAISIKQHNVLRHIVSLRASLQPKR